MEPITPQLVRRLLPPRPPGGHKGTFGRVYIYGGCPDYTGAPVYAGEAAVRTGRGRGGVGVPVAGGRGAGGRGGVAGRRRRSGGSGCSWRSFLFLWCWTRTA